MAVKTDIDKKDETSLNIILNAVPLPEENRLGNKIVGISEIVKEPWAGQYETIGTNGESEHLRGKLVTSVMLGLSLLVLAGNGWILYQRNQVEKIMNGAAIMASSANVSIQTQGIPMVSTTTADVSSAAEISAATTTTTASSSSPAPDLAAYSIEILNGSGVSGAAQIMQGILEKNGFTVAATGNANNFNYADTVVSYKKDIPGAYRAALEQALSMGYTISEGSPLSEIERVDVKIIIGKK